MAKENYRVTYTTSIDPEIKQEFKTLCSKKGLQMNEVIEKLITEWIEREGVEDGYANQHK